MTNAKFENFTIHALTPKGVRVVLSGSDYAAKGRTIYPGDVLEVTEQIRDANRDRAGECFLELTADQQRARWGEVRFDRGAEVPQSVHDALEQRRLDALRSERADILWSGGLRGNGDKSARLKVLNAELGVDA